MKKIVFIMILIFSLSFLTGCDNKSIKNLNANDFIMLSLDISSNGRIVQSLDFSVNSERLDSICSEEEKQKFISNLVVKVDELRSEFLLNYTILYIQNPNEEYKLNKGLVLTNATYNQESDSVGFNIIFTSIGSWNYYHSSTQSSNGKDENGNIFLTKNQSVGSFPFSSKMKISEDETIYVGDRYRLQYLSAGSGMTFVNQLENLYNPIYIYNYSTYYSRIHSDSDYKFTDANGHSHHVWTIDSQSLSADNKILIYSYTINAGYWYLFILIFSFIFALILLCILNYKKIKMYLQKLFKKLNKKSKKW